MPSRPRRRARVTTSAKRAGRHRRIRRRRRRVRRRLAPGLDGRGHRARPERHQPGVADLDLADAALAHLIRRSRRAAPSTRRSARDGRTERIPAEPAVPPQASPAPGATCRPRSASALGLGALIIASLLLYRPSFVVLVSPGRRVRHATNWSRRSARSRRGRRSCPLLVGGVAMDAAAWFRGPERPGRRPAGHACAEWSSGGSADGAAGYLRDVSASAVLVLLYLPLLAGFAVLLAHAGRRRGSGPRVHRHRRMQRHRAGTPPACCSASIRSRRSSPRARPGRASPARCSPAALCGALDHDADLPPRVVEGRRCSAWRSPSPRRSATSASR